MRVVCIDDVDKNPLPNCPYVKRGKIYTVSEIYNCPIRKRDYYVFFENGGDNGYLTTCFIEIQEDQKDEMELLEQRNEHLQNQ